MQTWPTATRRRAAALVAAPLGVVVLGILAALLGAVAVGIALVVVGLGVGAAGWWLGSPARLVARLGGRAADPVRDARVLNLVEGLSASAGLLAPEVRVLDDPAPNLLVVGAKPSAAVLFCTRGLLEGLDRMELEGVLSHELAHLRRGDTALATLAMRACSLLATWWSGTPRLVVRLAGPTRETYADFAGARITRYPPGLAAALQRLDAGPTRPAGVDAFTARLTGGLWCAPFAEAAPKSPVAGLLSLSERAAALIEL